MARVEVPITVINSSTGLPVNGASVAITRRSSGAAATWWTAETGGTGSTAPVVTDANGRVNAWVDRGAYNAQISGTGITTYTEPFDATPGGDQTVDQPWLDATVLPSGIVLPFGGPAAPGGWLVCDGAAVNRVTYATLFAAIGTLYGVGDNSTTFNVPDLKGRVPMGAGAGTGLTSRSRGDKGGEETHTLTTPETPTHRLWNDDGIGTALAVDTGTQYGPSSGNIGGGGSHNNLQPYLVLNYIIKT